MAIYSIETTIPVVYHEVRAVPEMVATRDWTRRWYDDAVASDRIASSAAVLDELQRSDFPGRDDCLEMLNTIEMLALMTLSLKSSRPTWQTQTNLGKFAESMVYLDSSLQN